MRFIILLIVFVGFTKKDLSSQELVQFSGVIVNNDSLTPIPFVNVMIKSTYRGTVTDFYGFFSFVAQKKDTIIFSCLGYKTAMYVVPDSLTEKRYSIIQVLFSDTINLDEVFVYPWPSREEFKESFMHLQIPNDDYQRALYNLDRQRLLEHMNVTAMDGGMNYHYQMQQYQNKIYHAGQAPPMNILNPLAWAQFIEAWKRGDFKKKK
jgi:hypothetical protein